MRNTIAKSGCFVKHNTGYCIVLYFALNLEKSLKNGKKSTAISMHVHRGKDTNGLGSVHRLRSSALLCPKSTSHSCTFASLSNRRGLEQHKYKQFNSKDGQKIYQNSIMEFIQKKIFQLRFSGGRVDRWGKIHRHTSVQSELLHSYLDPMVNMKC